MSISFKIFVEGIEKTVLAKGDLVSYKNDYPKLRSHIIDKSNAPLFKRSKKQLDDKSLFVLEQDKKEQIIGGIESIYDTESLNYLIEKIQMSEKGDVKLRFELKTVKMLPKLERPKYCEIFAKSLNFSFESLKEKILKDLEKINENKKIENKNVFCNNCFKQNFKGLRYICSECDNYNLCENCYNFYNSNHYNKEHLFIRLNNPVDVNLELFNNQFTNNNQNFYDVKTNSFDINLNIFNNGEENLCDCFITAIKFGEKYLKCEKLIIGENIKQNEQKDVQIKIKDFCCEKGIYKGLFRMFTKQGLPFGDILNVTVINKTD